MVPKYVTCDEYRQRQQRREENRGFELALKARRIFGRLKLIAVLLELLSS
jgi:hypothetical protein